LAKEGVNIVRDYREEAWKRFVAHCARCHRCHQAGGEWASEEALCPVGRTLAQTWQAEEAAILEEV
jgi:hypothetical protein